MYLTVKDGKIVDIEGDEEHPINQGRLCPRCLALKEFEEHPDRLRYPMKRAREDRGKDKWERITWEEALDIAETEIRKIWEKYGAHTIMLVGGTGREATLYYPAFAQAVLGTPNYAFCMSGSSCYGPRAAVADFLLGCGYPELDYAQYFPDRYDNPQYEVPKYIILWGKSPLQSNPDGFYGPALVDLMKRGSQFITIDPRLTWIGVRAAYHLQLRPGTDAALGLAMLNIIISEDLYDHEFVENWCYGFDALAERVADKTPEWAAEICWLDPELIRAATRAFATSKPSSWMWGLATDTQANGVQAGHCMLAIVALCGYIDVPGGVILGGGASFMGKWRWDCSKWIDEETMKYRMDAHEWFPGFAVGPIAHPDTLFNVLTSGKPFEFHMFWMYATNPFACEWAEPEVWRDAMMKMDFIAGNDVFMTPSLMQLADLVFPISGFAAHEGFVMPHFGRNSHFLGAINPAIDPGECKSDIELNFLLGKRLKPEAWPWDSVADFFTEQLHTMYDFSFEDLQDMYYFPQHLEYRRYEKGLLRPDGEPGFNTPTGLLELESSLYPDFYEDALPYFEEPPYSPVSTPELWKEYPLVLTTGGREYVSFHSEHRQIPSLRQHVPWATVTINPETAKEYGIETGDWVAIENMFGKCIQKARVSIEVEPRVVHAHHGWWYPEQDGEAPNLFGVWKSDINKLIPMNYVGGLGYGAPYKNMICKIYKVDSLDAFGANDEKIEFEERVPWKNTL